VRRVALKLRRGCRDSKRDTIVTPPLYNAAPPPQPPACLTPKRRLCGRALRRRHHRRARRPHLPGGRLVRAGDEGGRPPQCGGGAPAAGPVGAGGAGDLCRAGGWCGGVGAVFSHGVWGRGACCTCQCANTVLSVLSPAEPNPNPPSFTTFHSQPPTANQPPPTDHPHQALLVLSGYADASPHGAGLFYGGDGRQLGLQLLGAAILAAWTAVWSLVLFVAMRWAGLLRVGVADEMIGERGGVSLGWFGWGVGGGGWGWDHGAVRLLGP